MLGRDGLVGILEAERRRVRRVVLETDHGTEIDGDSPGSRLKAGDVTPNDVVAYRARLDLEVRECPRKREFPTRTIRIPAERRCYDPGRPFRSLSRRFAVKKIVVLLAAITVMTVGVVSPTPAKKKTNVV